MKKLVLYYSLSGHSKRIALDIAAKEKCAIAEVREVKKRSILGAFFSGALAARGRRHADIMPVHLQLSAYDTIVLIAPIWAGYPAPALNSMIAMLPEGKDVELILSSGSGSSKGSAAGTKALVETRGCHVAAYRDIAATAK